MAFLVMEIRSKNNIDSIYANLIDRIEPFAQIKTSLLTDQGVLLIYHEDLTLSVCKTKKIVAETLAYIIVDKWEFSMIKNVIENSFYYFTVIDREQIAFKAQEILTGQDKDKNNYLSCPSPTHRQDKITQLLTDYLYDQNYLNIEGFINFRLQDYWENLEGAVKLAVEDYMREKEYDDFVRLLKYFVDAQEPRVGTVNILLMAPGPMQSLDKIVNKTKNIYINGFIFDMVDSEINSEDVLISALISIAPRRVILHVPVPKKVNNVIVTLQKVFGERLKICAGCTCCHNLGEKQ